VIQNPCLNPAGAAQKHLLQRGQTRVLSSPLQLQKLAGKASKGPRQLKQSVVKGSVLVIILVSRLRLVLQERAQSQQ